MTASQGIWLNCLLCQEWHCQLGHVLSCQQKPVENKQSGNLDNTREMNECEEQAVKDSTRTKGKRLKLCQVKIVTSCLDSSSILVCIKAILTPNLYIMLRPVS